MATETLRPSAAGDECNISYQSGAACPNHYQNVDEVTPDEDTTEVRGMSDYNWGRDLYNLPASSGTGTINKITVYARCWTEGTPARTSLKIACKTEGTAYEGTEKTISTSWVTYSQEWAVNPDTSSAWTWTQIDALQIGIALRRIHPSSGFVSNCTQVYVEVDYSPPTNYERSLTTAIGLSASLSSVFGHVRSLSTAIGMSATLSRSVTFGRPLSTAIGLSASLSRAATYGRSLSTSIGLSTTLSRLQGFVRSLDTSIGMSATLSRNQGHVRSLSTSIGLSASLSRIHGHVRSLTTAIGLYTWLRWTTKIKRRIASIGTNRTIGEVGTPRDIEGVGDNRDIEGW